MPSLGADMDSGIVSRWMVKPGDEVHRGDIVAVVETEKSTIEVEIFENGIVEEIVVPEGAEVPVGSVLARVGPGEAATVGARAPARAEAAPVEAARAPAKAARAPAIPAQAPVEAASGALPATAAPPQRPPTLPPKGVITSPVIRHVARTLGVDLSTIVGSGAGGAVTRADVEGAARVAPARASVRSSPLARRLAAETGVDLASVKGTGPGGAVVERDVRLGVPSPQEGDRVAAAVTAMPMGTPMGTPTAMAPGDVGGGGNEPASTAEAGVDRQAALRHAIGALMARSKREIPHYYLSTTIDMSRASAWLERANLDRPVTKRLVMPVLLLKATALAVAQVPEMNGFMVADRFEPSRAVHVGVAVSLRSGGVIAPAVHDTDRSSLDDLMASLRDLVGRARTGVLRSSEMSDPTITVTNLGDLGVEAVFGVIYPPQVALVGFGRVAERPWASEGMLGVRPCVVATLSADHRASDGHRGGIFLSAIDRLLQEPGEL